MRSSVDVFACAYPLVLPDIVAVVAQFGVVEFPSWTPRSLYRLHSVSIHIKLDHTSVMKLIDFRWHPGSSPTSTGTRKEADTFTISVNPTVRPES